MLGHQISAIAGSVLKEIGAASNLMVVLERSHALQAQIQISLAKVLTADNNAQAIVNARNESVNLTQACIAELKKLKASQVYRDVDRLEALVSELRGFKISSDIELKSYLVIVADFRHSYDFFLSEGNAPALLGLLTSASDLRNRIMMITELMSWGKSISEGIEIPGEGEDELSIYFGGNHSLVEISEKLQAIDGLFKDFAQILQVAHQHPRVAKLEAGCLWLKIIGDSAVIGLVTWVIRESVQYLHRQYTSEGKIGSIPKQMESLDSIFRMREKFSAAGINTDSVDEGLRRTLVGVVNNANSLLIREPEVHVNDDKYSVGDVLAAKMLGESKPRLLEMEPNNPRLPTDPNDANKRGQPPI